MTKTPHEFAADYHFELEDGRTITPTEAERAMIEDAIEGWESTRAEKEKV